VITNGLVGEDCLVFDQPLAYSIKTIERTSLLRSKAEHARKWPVEIQNNLKMASLDKYKIFYSQVQAVQEKLNSAENRRELRFETKMQKRLQKNYPVAIKPLQDRLKAQSLLRLNNFKPEFLVNKDERFVRDSKPLQGYVTSQDLKRLDRIGEYFIKPLTRAQIEKRLKCLKDKASKVLSEDRLSSNSCSVAVPSFKVVVKDAKSSGETTPALTRKLSRKPLMSAEKRADSKMTTTVSHINLTNLSQNGVPVSSNGHSSVNLFEPRHLQNCPSFGSDYLNRARMKQQNRAKTAKISSMRIEPHLQEAPSIRIFKMNQLIMAKGTSPNLGSKLAFA